MKKVVLFLFLTLAGIPGTFGQTYISGVDVERQDFPVVPYRIDCDTIFSIRVLDASPIGLTFDGTHLCTRGSGSHSIIKYNLNGFMTGSLFDPSGSVIAGDLDFDGTNFWIVSEQEAKLYKTDAVTGNVLATFALPTIPTSDPNTWGCAFENGFIWTTDYRNGTLMRINATTGALVDSFYIHRKVLPVKIIKGDLYGIEFKGTGNPALMQLLKFNKSTGEVVDSLPWCLPDAMGLSWAADHLWGLSGGFVGLNSIVEFHARVLDIREGPASAREISLFPNPAGNRLFVNTGYRNMKMHVWAVQGKCVLEHDLGMGPNELNIEGLARGMYLVTFSGGDWTEQMKLIKK